MIIEQWSNWLRLQEAWQSAPGSQGLYRIRRVGGNTIDYIGQTGLTVRKRLAMLRGVYGTVMPYRDPHTAAPALWAVRDATGCEFEASWIVLTEVSTQQRKGLECLAIALYRQEQGASPLFNFGRMPHGYGPSSGNNARLVASGSRLRGGRCLDLLACHQLGCSPTGPLNGRCGDLNWVGLNWSAWKPILDVEPPQQGLYRLRGSGAEVLLYVGEGLIKSRLAAHLQKGRDEIHRQARWFGASMECSTVPLPGSFTLHRLEIETDLIGSHMLQHGHPPLAQFLG